MITYKGKIIDSSIRIKPSKKLYDYISGIKAETENLPAGIASIILKTKRSADFEKTTSRYFLNDEDLNFIDSLENHKSSLNNSTENKKPKVYDKILVLNDLYWLYDHLRTDSNKIFLHELLEGSEILLPENPKIQRNPQLEKRCQELKIKQENARYKSMTKSVDNSRRQLPEDTVAYQMKEMNKQIIAIFQFIVSVLAGFAFGFIGIEILVGTLDFGFRLLLGIMFGLIVALAELYFLAKKLNEDYIDYDRQKKVQ